MLEKEYLFYGMDGVKNLWIPVFHSHKFAESKFAALHTSLTKPGCLVAGIEGEERCRQNVNAAFPRTLDAILL